MIPPRGRKVKADSSMFLVGGGGRDNSKTVESVDKAEDMKKLELSSRLKPFVSSWSHY